VGFGIIVLGYMGLLYFGAIIVPGDGVVGKLMSLVPSGLWDLAHAPAYGILAVLLILLLKRRGWPSSYAFPIAAAAALVFGLWTEVVQGSIHGRQSSVEDLVVDGIGIAVATILMLSETIRNKIAILCPWL
jgi:VanZ family protein